jgi:flagellar basal-body rod modification protein FlgD
MVNGITTPAFLLEPVKRDAPSSVVGKDDFLKMLVTQMRYQDPMDPMKGTEFAAQLAQFSSVEQLNNLNTQMEESLQANNMLATSINNALATTLIGKQVRFPSNTLSVGATASETNPVKFGYVLSQEASSVTIEIKNARGEVVRTLSSDKGEAEAWVGDHLVPWDGLDNYGEKVAPGKYTYKVKAADAAGTELTTANYVLGAVTAVRYKSDGAVFVVGGEEIPLSEILEIMQG